MHLSKVFRDRLDAWKISGIELSEASGRSRQSISRIRQCHASPYVRELEELVKVCDNLRPGFAADYYASLGGERVELNTVIDRLNADDVILALALLVDRLAQLNGIQDSSAKTVKDVEHIKPQYEAVAA